MVFLVNIHPQVRTFEAFQAISRFSIINAFLEPEKHCHVSSSSNCKAVNRSVFLIMFKYRLCFKAIFF